jgi:uridine kinase
VYALDGSIRNYFDVTIWIEYPASLGFERGIARDILRDGVDNSDKWKDKWMPLEENYVKEQEPDKAADYIVDGRNIYL